MVTAVPLLAGPLDLRSRDVVPPEVSLEERAYGDDDFAARHGIGQRALGEHETQTLALELGKSLRMGEDDALAIAAELRESRERSFHEDLVSRLLLVADHRLLRHRRLLEA
jgi:hypothetical protein